MPNLFGRNHVIAIDELTPETVGGEFQMDGRTVRAPIDVAKAIDRLSQGPARLSQFELDGLSVAGVPVLTGPTGHTKALVPISRTCWFAPPAPPKAPERPVATQTLRWPTRH